MRKEIKTAIGLAMLAGLAFGYVSNQADKASDIVAENVEALAGDGEETAELEPCYYAIFYKPGVDVRYCPLCKKIPGMPDPEEKPGDCREQN